MWVPTYKASSTPPIPKYFVLEYLQSSGTQYINTGYIPLADDAFLVRTKLISNTSSNYEALFGTRLTTYKYNAYAFFMRFNSTNKFCYNRTGVETSLSSNVVYDEAMLLYTNGSTVHWESATTNYTGSTTGTINDCVNPLFIFNLNTASTSGGATADTSPAYAQLYFFQVIRGGKTIYNYVPVLRLSDMSYGLYDKVNNVFYGNSGSGTFIGGSTTGEYIYE